MTCSAVDLGMTGWCSSGRHDQCAHRRGGIQERGVWFPECYVGVRVKGKLVVTLAQAAVVSPSHRYFCPCQCHSENRGENIPDFIPGGLNQLRLFEVHA